MARVVAFIPDLLFGSNVQGALAAAGHQVVLVNDLAGLQAGDVDVLVVDLTADAQERIAIVRAASLDAVPKLAFYAHVETEIRALAQQAGFVLAIPRSRMAREAASLVAGLQSPERPA